MKKIHWLFIYLCVVITTSSYAAQALDVEKESFHLYLLIGQSNMAGRGVPTEQDQTPHPRVFMLNKENEWAPAVEPLHFDKPQIAGVGPGFAFGKAMAEANPDCVIGLIPCAVGGSPISVWKAGAYYEPTKSHPYDDAIQRAQIAMRKGVLKGILWHQGEGDSNPIDGPLYEERLIDLIKRLRAVLDSPDVPFIAGELAKTFTDKRPEHKYIHDAIRAVSKSVPNTYWVSAKGLTCKSDNVHFNTKSTRELGRRYAAIMIRHYKDQ